MCGYTLGRGLKLQLASGVRIAVRFEVVTELPEE
jgi:enoyl-CoA hydratase/carnithine racemase